MHRLNERRVDQFVDWAAERGEQSQGVPMRTLQAWMGHADIQTTMIYADYAPDATNGRDWVNRAFSGPMGQASAAEAIATGQSSSAGVLVANA